MIYEIWEEGFFGYDAFSDTPEPLIIGNTVNF
jgi:hypothetical protein